MIYIKKLFTDHVFFFNNNKIKNVLNSINKNYQKLKIKY